MLYRANPSKRRIAFYERVLFNHILAAHDPKHSMCCYYTTMSPGGYRVYSDEFDSMWCCTGTGLEVPGKYGQMIFSGVPDGDALNVNLFAGAELKWGKRRVSVRQTTDFPYGESSTLAFQCAEPTVHSARPSSVMGGRWQIQTNRQRGTHSGGLQAGRLRRGAASLAQRRRGTYRVPDALTAETLPGDDRYVALLYGPIVLSGESDVPAD